MANEKFQRNILLYSGIVKLDHVFGLSIPAMSIILHLNLRIGSSPRLTCPKFSAP